MIISKIRALRKAMSRGAKRLRPVMWRDALVLRIFRRRCLHFRIGVNHGDVMSDGVRVYGDGLNVAARSRRSRASSGLVSGSRPVAGSRWRDFFLVQAAFVLIP